MVLPLLLIWSRIGGVLFLTRHRRSIMSDPNEKSDQVPKGSDDSSKTICSCPITALADVAPRFFAAVICIFLGIALYHLVLKPLLGIHIVAFIVSAVCLTLFACWIYKKGFDAGRK